MNPANNVPYQMPIANVGNHQHYGAPRVVNHWLAANQGPVNAFANIGLAYEAMYAGNDQAPRPEV